MGNDCKRTISGTKISMQSIAAVLCTVPTTDRCLAKLLSALLFPFRASSRCTPVQPLSCRRLNPVAGAHFRHNRNAFPSLSSWIDCFAQGPGIWSYDRHCSASLGIYIFKVLRASCLHHRCSTSKRQSIAVEKSYSNPFQKFRCSLGD